MTLGIAGVMANNLFAGIFNAASAQDYRYGNNPNQNPQQFSSNQLYNGYYNNRVRAYPNQVPNSAPVQQPNPNQPRRVQFNSSVQIAYERTPEYDNHFLKCSGKAAEKTKDKADAMYLGFFYGCMMNLGYNTNNLP